MDFLTKELAEKLCDLVGGKSTAPCFANMLEAATKLSKKRKRGQARAEPVLATRLSVIADTDNRCFP
tara:strand:+ start:2255 stop:2455 length:201 start_codon:yes stop_codon:yes gene_type:complete